jgi:hypothetical protein
MTDKVRKWSKALAAAFITGCAGSLLSALGISGAQAAGVDVTQLSLKQLAVMTLAGGIIGMAAYLKQSPLPTDP